jgi:hypothetical protein
VLKIGSVTLWRAAGLLMGICVIGAAIVAYRSSADVGYVQINTVPVAPLTQTALYLDTTKLDPIRQGSALLRQRVGMLKLQAASFGGALAPLCDIEVRKDRITTVTVSVLERPPRCQCRFSGGGDAAHACVS